MSDENGGQASGGQARSSAPWLDLEPGTEVAGFTIEEPLASGSFGCVFRARRGGRPFAIKLMLMEPRSDREVEALRLMRHPNVVCFHGYGFWPEEKPRFLVLTMELVEGRALDEWAKQENPSALELVMRVLLPLALTLADVHTMGVVHRDIKESNIVMREADGQPVLVDFGAAGLEGAPRLTIRLPPGTVEYRSPEAWRFARDWEGEPYPFKPADDLWAYGVVTYVLLTRQLPFGDRNDPEMRRRILEVPPPAPHELNPNVPPALSELCMRLLEKQPKHRYADAKALADALSTEWARADRSWRVPLFPENRREKSAAPPSAPPESAKPEPPKLRPWWGSWLVLIVVLVLSSLAAWWWRSSTGTPFAQRAESPRPPPPQQASPRQELAPEKVTGEVVRGAGLQKSPTPAPVATATNSEDAQMTKSQKTRALLAAGCIAGSACASGPQQRQPPKPAECPPGFDVTYERFGMVRANPWHSVDLIPVTKYPQAVPVQEGEVTGESLGPWGRDAPSGPLPDRTIFSGRMYFGTDRVYGRFTSARLPSGEVVPVCLQIAYINDQKPGRPMEPGSTRDRVLLSSVVDVVAVNHFD